MSDNQKTVLKWASLPECHALPDGWSVTSFTKIADVIAGQSPPSETYNTKGLGLPFLQGNAEFGHVYPIPQIWCTDPKKTAARDDILISVRAPVGELNRADQDYAIGRGLAAVRAAEIDVGYLYQAIQRWRWSLQRVAQGTTFDAVTTRHFTQLQVAIPTTPDEQVAIACVLDAVDTAIEQTREAAARAKDLDHSLLNTLLENGLNQQTQKQGPYPAHWQIHRVDEVAEVGSGLTLGRDVSGYKSVELPYLRVANVQDGHLDLSLVKTIRVPISEVDNYRLEAGDVLMTEGGDIDKLGRGTIWEGQIPDCLHQNHIFRVRANRQIVEPYYFAFMVESDIAKRYFFRVAKRTTNLASINKTILRAFRFPVPPLDEQREIVKVVKAAKLKIEALIQKQVALWELKKSLMHDLLTGRVRVDPHRINTLMEKAP